MICFGSKCICFVCSHHDKLKKRCHPTEWISHNHASHLWILHWNRCSYAKKEKSSPPTSELFGKKYLTDSVLRFASVVIEVKPACGFSTEEPQWYLSQTEICFLLTLIDNWSQSCLSLLLPKGLTKKLWYIYVRQPNVCFKEPIPISIIQNPELGAVLPISYQRIKCLRTVTQKLIPSPQ